MKFFKSVLFIALCVVACYLTWLIFYWLTPFIMGLSWFWMIFIFLVLGGFAIPLVGLLPGLLSVVGNRLHTGHLIEVIVNILIIGYFAFSACRLAWTINISSGLKEIIFALMQNSLVIGVYWGLLNSFVLGLREN